MFVAKMAIANYRYLSITNGSHHRLNRVLDALIRDQGAKKDVSKLIVVAFVIVCASLIDASSIRHDRLQN